MQAPKNHKTKR